MYGRVRLKVKTAAAAAKSATGFALQSGLSVYYLLDILIMKQNFKLPLPEQRICIGRQNRPIVRLMHILLFISLTAMSHSVSAQEEKSTTVLIAPASQADKSGLSDSSTSKLTRMQQSGTYGLLLLVKVGNLAKIQKNGVLTFTIPGSGESVTYKAKKVVAYSESDFTWYGSSDNGDALFICKNGELSGTFRFNKKFFELYNIEGEFYVLSHIRTDLEIKCDTEGGAYRSEENRVNDRGAQYLTSPPICETS